MIVLISQSCKNSQKEKDKDIENNTNTPKPLNTDNYTYTKDSQSDEIAVLVFGPDGSTEYVVDKPENIYQKTLSGLEYRYILASKNKKRAKVGDVIYINMEYRTENDSILFRSNDIDSQFKMRLSPLSHASGCIEEALLMLSEGDSAVFKIDATNFLMYTQNKSHIPEFVKPNDKFIFNIKMNKIVDNKEFLKQNTETYSHYLEQEKSLIERYVLEINRPRTILKSGLNTITISKGTGKKVKDGNTVKINYVASFIDGQIFDSTIERNEPFDFVIGKKQVIDGLEEGVKLMNVGDHYIFIIPFKLAYGETKHGMIPPFSTLVFEVELLDAK